MTAAVPKIEAPALNAGLAVQTYLWPLPMELRQLHGCRSIFTSKGKSMPETSPKKVSPAFFGFALFCFLLPFVTVSCPGGQATISGYELVVGGEIQGEKVNGEGLAVFAFLFALAGLALSFWKDEKEGLIGTGVAGGAAAGLLLILQTKIASDVADGTGGLATVSYEVGYWLAILALAGGAVFSFYLRSQSAAAESHENPAPPEEKEAVPVVEEGPRPDE